MLELLPFGLQTRLRQTHCTSHREALVSLVKESRVALHRLTIQRTHYFPAGLERTAGLIALRAIIEDALDALTGELLAETFQDNLTREDQKRSIGPWRNVEALGAYAETLSDGLGKVQFGDDVGLNREHVALRVREPTPPHALQVERRRAGTK